MLTQEHLICSSAFEADLYCYKECIRNYIRKGETATATNVSTKKGSYFDKVVQEIDQGLNMGKCYDLSYLRVCCNEMRENAYTFFMAIQVCFKYRAYMLQVRCPCVNIV